MEQVILGVIEALPNFAFALIGAAFALYVYKDMTARQDRLIAIIVQLCDGVDAETIQAFANGKH